MQVLLEFFDINAGHQQDLAIGLLTRQQQAEGRLVGPLHQGIDHRFGLFPSAQFHLGRGQGLAAGNHHIAAAQGDHLGFQPLEFLLSCGNAASHLRQFGFGAANFRIPTFDISAEPIPLALETLTLVLQGLEFLPQGTYPLLGCRQLAGHDPLAFDRQAAAL